jgi:ChrB-like protein
VPVDWLLLIYTLPSQPSRKRAYVWRELKRFGALYLRDGVALLPRQPELEEHLRDIVVRIEEFEGEADLIVSPGFTAARTETLIERFRDEREAEYREVYHACVRFLRDVLHDVDADDFGFPDVDNLESELGRLRRWYGQVAGRDYFSASGSQKVEEILEKCARAFDHFVSTASERQDRPAVASDDVFERLGGPPVTAPDDLPL